MNFFARYHDFFLELFNFFYDFFSLFYLCINLIKFIPCNETVLYELFKYLMSIHGIDLTELEKNLIFFLSYL